MNIVVLTGSPRKHGNSAYLADSFIKGAEEQGHQVFRFDCAFAQVHPCIGCNKCGMNGSCVFDDDFLKLRPHLIAADVVVMATPMYYFQMSGQLKSVIDRFYAINGLIKGAPKKAAYLITFADDDLKEAEPMIQHFNTMTHYLGWENIGVVAANGVWNIGDVHQTSFVEKAYALGKSLSQN